MHFNLESLKIDICRLLDKGRHLCNFRVCFLHLLLVLKGLRLLFFVEHVLTDSFHLGDSLREVPDRLHVCVAKCLIDIGLVHREAVDTRFAALCAYVLLNNHIYSTPEVTDVVHERVFAPVDVYRAA